jgi:hypothetical protein
MFTCALTTGTDVPLTQNKTAKSNISFFFITFLFSVSPPATASRKQSASPLFELACLLVRLDHVASFIVSANQSVM